MDIWLTIQEPKSAERNMADRPEEEKKSSTTYGKKTNYLCLFHKRYIFGYRWAHGPFFLSR
jgi:hypothetical protein